MGSGRLRIHATSRREGDSIESLTSEQLALGGSPAWRSSLASAARGRRVDHDWHRRSLDVQYNTDRRAQTPESAARTAIERHGYDPDELDRGQFPWRDGERHAEDRVRRREPQGQGKTRPDRRTRRKEAVPSTWATTQKPLGNYLNNTNDRVNSHPPLCNRQKYTPLPTDSPPSSSPFHPTSYRPSSLSLSTNPRTRCPNAL